MIEETVDSRPLEERRFLLFRSYDREGQGAMRDFMGAFGDLDEGIIAATVDEYCFINAYDVIEGRWIDERRLVIPDRLAGRR